MEDDNILNKQQYKLSINLDEKKIFLILENKEESTEIYQNNYSFEQLTEKQIKLISCNTIDIILNLINASIKENKYSISKNKNDTNEINILFQIKNAFDNTDISLNLSLYKITSESELIKKNLSDLNNEIKKLKKENEELKKQNEEIKQEVKLLNNKMNTNAVLLVPGEHNQWDKKCPYCNSADIKKDYALQFKSWHSGTDGPYHKYYLHHFCNNCKKIFFAPDNGYWKD